MSDVSTIFQVWEKQGEGYVSTPRKMRDTASPKGSKNQKGKWEEKNFKWPEQINDIKTYIQESHRGGYDLYWCPTLMNSDRRVRENIPNISVLYADLDDVNPSSLPDNLRPSVAWESSPNRYAALWYLDGSVPSEIGEEINKSLTYHIGADHGGWDITQVLRIPGTRNYKYDNNPPGKLLWHEDTKIDTSFIPMLPKEQAPLPVEEDLSFDTSPARLLSLVSSVKDKLKPKTLSLLISSDEDILLYDRSEKLWELECQLIEQGVSPTKTLELVACSNWNKYRGRKDEMRRLQTEIDKVLSHTSKSTTGDAPTDRVKGMDKEWTSYTDLLSMQVDQPGWMIEGVWQKTSHGMIAGEPKTYKSVIATDMAVAVASGRPFLGKYPVHHQGPVLYIQEENSPWLVKDRVTKVATSTGALRGSANLFGGKLTVDMPEELPLYFLNNMGFDFTSEEDKEFLEKSVEEIKPVLIIFDPLYLMLGGKDENSSKDIRPVLNWLLSLRYKYKTSIIIIHHWNKSGKSERGGQRMLGSVLFHGWVESAMYTRVVNEQSHQIDIEREFRSFSKPDNISVTFNFGQPGDDYYEAKIGSVAAKLSADSIISLLREAGRVTVEDIKVATGLPMRQINQRLAQLIKEGQIEKRDDIYIYKGDED